MATATERQRRSSSAKEEAQAAQPRARSAGTGRPEARTLRACALGSGCAGLHLRLQIVLQAHAFDQTELGFEVIDVFFGIAENVFEKFA